MAKRKSNLEQKMEMFIANDELGRENLRLKGVIRDLEAQLAEARANLATADNELNSAAYDLERYQRELAEARKDGARLDWLESQCVLQMAVPQFWRNRNGKISFAPYDEAKLVEGENVRAAIDAAMKGGGK